VHKRHGNLDNKFSTRHCLGFIVEVIKARVKKKRTLAFYTLHMTKKDLVIGGWVGLGQLLVAARQTVQRNNVLIIVYLLLNRLKCQILRTWN
jgi:hypothetical protein